MHTTRTRDEDTASLMCGFVELLNKKVSLAIPHGKCFAELDKVDAIVRDLRDKVMEETYTYLTKLQNGARSKISDVVHCEADVPKGMEVVEDYKKEVEITKEKALWVKKAIGLADGCKRLEWRTGERCTIMSDTTSKLEVEKLQELAKACYNENAYKDIREKCDAFKKRYLKTLKH